MISNNILFVALHLGAQTSDTSRKLYNLSTIGNISKTIQEIDIVIYIFLRFCLFAIIPYIITYLITPLDFAIESLLICTKVHDLKCHAYCNFVC